MGKDLKMCPPPCYCLLTFIPLSHLPSIAPYINTSMTSDLNYCDQLYAYFQQCRSFAFVEQWVKENLALDVCVKSTDHRNSLAGYSQWDRRDNHTHVIFVIVFKFVAKFWAKF